MHILDFSPSHLYLKIVLQKEGISRYYLELPAQHRFHQKHTKAKSVTLRENDGHEQRIPYRSGHSSPAIRPSCPSHRPLEPGPAAKPQRCLDRNLPRHCPLPTKGFRDRYPHVNTGHPTAAGQRLRHLTSSPNRPSTRAAFLWRRLREYTSRQGFKMLSRRMRQIPRIFYKEKSLRRKGEKPRRLRRVE